MSLDRDLVASALERYDVGEELGRGGCGVVLSGRHRQLGRIDAIKQLPRAFGADPAVRQRFLQEAKVVASLRHPHIVEIHDFVETGGLCLIVMEHLGGGTLWEWFTSSGVTVEQAVAVAIATCSALQCAHERGVLHRDIKPENLMFTDSGTLKVTDFGIAKVIGGSDALVTSKGEVLGTPAYMAPEQAQASDLGPHTDVYAVGVMLYELLSGRLPFEDTGDALALLYRHVYEEPEPLASVAPGVPYQVRDAVMRAIQRDTGARFASSGEFGDALGRAGDASLGSSWLTRSGVRVLAGSTTHRPAEGPPTRPAAPAPRAPVTEVTPGSDRAAGPPGTEGAAAAGPRPSRPSGAPVVRPVTAVHTGGEVAVDAPSIAVEPLSQAIERPPGPWRLVGASALLLLGALGLALIGIGSPSRSGSIPGLAVNGVEIDRGRVVADLADPLVLTGIPARAEGVSITLSVLGLAVGSADAEVARDGEGATATLDVAASRYVAGGTVTARLQLLGADGRRLAGPGSARSFSLRAQRPLWLTVPGAVGVLLGFYLAANVESLLRSLRRGRKRVVARIALTAIGAAVGLDVANLVWLGAGVEPTWPTLVACVALGGAAGSFVSEAGRRVHARRRFRLKRARSGAVPTRA